jgi:hypothetical protein
MRSLSPTAMVLMSSVAFATYQEEPGITADDAPVAGALRRAGVNVTPVVWDDVGASWSEFDAVLIRSAWDYHLKAGQFERWVRSFTSTATMLWNPPDQVLWNMNKTYLLDLAARGVPVVPTEYLTKADRSSLRAILARCGWAEAVVKPAVAAGSHGARRRRARPDLLNKSASGTS